MPFDFQDLKVLFVDDAELMRELGASILEILNVGHVDTAISGKQAFQKFCEGDFNLVITDYIMPGMSGVNLATKIRKDPQSPDQTVPIIIITGHLSDEFIKEARDAGINELILKPFSASDLTKRLAFVVQNPRDLMSVGEYAGPDRRSTDDPGYNGPERRS